jgi:UDP-N-acetyl-D-mannosaminuronic acid transferase (WecB/TagA/CpsF family)
MFSITTTQANGKIVAKGHGKQRTVSVDHSKSMGEAQHAVAVGALLDVLASPEQQAKILHPSGGQRVSRECVSDAGGKWKWSISV